MQKGSTRHPQSRKLGLKCTQFFVRNHCCGLRKLLRSECFLLLTGSQQWHFRLNIFLWESSAAMASKEEDVQMMSLGSLPIQVLLSMGQNISLGETNLLAFMLTQLQSNIFSWLSQISCESVQGLFFSSLWWMRCRSRRSITPQIAHVQTTNR